MGRAKNFIKNLIILSFGTILPRFSSIITLPIITGGLTQIEYGTYDLVTTLVSLLLPVVTLQIQVAAFRFLIDCREKKEESSIVISTIFTFCVCSSSVALFILYICLKTLSPITRLSICIYFFVDIMFRVCQQIVRGFSMNKVYSFSAVIESVLNLILVVFFIKVRNGGLIGVLLSVTLAEVVAGTVTFLFGGIFRSFSFKSISFLKLKEMLIYSGPMVPNNLSIWVLKFSDRMVLTGFLGLGATAVYGVANKIPNMLGMIMQSFTMAWQENASLSVNDNNVREYYSKMFDVIFRFMAGALSLLTSLTPILFKLLIHGDYRTSYIHIPLLFMAAFFDCIKTYIGGIYVAKKKTNKVAITTVIAAVINIVIDLALVMYIGIFAASISTLISCAFLALYRMYDIQKIQPIDFNMKAFSLIIAFLMVICILCGFQKHCTNVLNLVLSLIFAVYINKALIRVIWSRFSAMLK